MALGKLALAIPLFIVAAFAAISNVATGGKGSTTETETPRMVMARLIRDEGDPARLEAYAITCDNARWDDLARVAREKAATIRARNTGAPTVWRMPPDGSFDVHTDPDLPSDLGQMLLTTLRTVVDPDVLDFVPAQFPPGLYPITRTNFPRRAQQIRHYTATGDPTPPEFIDPTAGTTTVDDRPLNPGELPDELRDLIPNFLQQDPTPASLGYALMFYALQSNPNAVEIATANNVQGNQDMDALKALANARGLQVIGMGRHGGLVVVARVASARQWRMPPPGTFDAHWDPGIPDAVRQEMTDTLAVVVDPQVLEDLAPATLNAGYPIAATNLIRRSSQIEQYTETGDATPPPFIDPTDLSGNLTDVSQLPAGLQNPITSLLSDDPTAASLGFPVILFLADDADQAEIALLPGGNQDMAALQALIESRGMQVVAKGSHGGFLVAPAGAVVSGILQNWRYPVMPGDGTAGDIAQKLTGDRARWRELRDENPQLRAAIDQGVVPPGYIALPDSWVTPDGRLRSGLPLPRPLQVAA